MEVKEIYPKLPTAPPIEDQGQGYRLQKINEIQAFLENEVATREALSKKYFRATRIVKEVDTVLIAITLGGGAGGIGLLSMVIAAPTVIVIEGVALFTGLLSIVYRCFKFAHHERQCNADDHCKRCSANENETHHSEPCTRSPKCFNCGEEHYSTSRSCKVWQREKEIITIKYRESLSFAEAWKITDTRHALGSSYSSVTKSNIAKSVTLKDAQTQTNDASVQTEILQKQTSTTVKHQQPVSNKTPDKPVRNKSPNKSSDRVLSDRLPKGSDDPIQLHNRFHCLDEEDMEAENDHAEIHTNKQGRIIKLNNKK